MGRPLLDVPRLRQEVTKILQSTDFKVPSKWASKKAVGVYARKSIVTRLVDHMVQNEILLHNMRAHASVPDVIEKCGRKVNFKKLAKCKVVGRGAFGLVLDTGRGRCVKVERDVHPETVRVGMRAAAQMGKAGVGPKVHSWMLCDCAGAPILFMEMDLIEGMDLHTWMYHAKPRRADVAAVRAKLAEKVRRMRDEFGIRHNDLHEGNVRIDSQQEPWILDYSFSSEVDAVDRWFDIGQVPGDHQTMFRYVWTELLAQNLVVEEGCSEDAGPRLAALLSGADLF